MMKYTQLDVVVNVFSVINLFIQVNISAMPCTSNGSIIHFDGKQTLDPDEYQRIETLHNLQRVVVKVIHIGLDQEPPIFLLS